MVHNHYSHIGQAECQEERSFSLIRPDDESWRFKGDFAVEHRPHSWLLFSSQFHFLPIFGGEEDKAMETGLFFHEI